MQKTKFILPVFAMVLILGLSNAAFAQYSCNVASTPVSRGSDTGLTEPAGDLIFNCSVGNAATTTATISVDYGGLQITNNNFYPTGNVIRVQGAVGFSGGDPSISSVNNGSGQIIINMPAQNGFPGTGSSQFTAFTLTGVLLSLAGSGRTNVQANISVSPGSNVLITAGQNVATVITSVLPGIQAPRLTTNTTAGIVLTSGIVVVPGFSINVTENYIDMFKTAAQFNNGASTNGVQLIYTFNGIPAGVTLGSSTSPCTATMTQPAGSPGTVGSVTLSGGGTTAGTLTSTANTFTVEVTGAANNQAAESVVLACSTWVTGTTATVPFTVGSITATVTLAPTGAALGTSNAVLTTASTGQIPRYLLTPLPSPALTVLNIIPSTTHMLVPFVSIGNGFDTGFVVANTTGDPYGGTANGGARAQSGTVTVFFYPTTGSPFCVTTGGTATLTPGGTACTVLTTVGLGLGTGGSVASGSSWVVLGSEIFKQVTGAPTLFNGYAFAIANFTNAHALAFVADASFSGRFSAGGPALVLPNPALIGRIGTVLTGVAEGLGH